MDPQNTNQQQPQQNIDPAAAQAAQQQQAAEMSAQASTQRQDLSAGMPPAQNPAAPASAPTPAAQAEPEIDEPADIAVDVASQTPGGAGGGGTVAQATGGQQSGAAGTTDAEIAAAMERFEIPKVVIEKHKELVELVLVTQSMNDEERQYWFHILPIMSEAQVERLREILVTEQKKLAQLNQSYNARVLEINQKYLIKWKDQETKQKREDLKQAESTARAEEEAAGEALLGELDNL